MQRKIIYSLLGISIVLLFVNISIELFGNSSNDDSKTHDFSINTEKKIFEVLHDFSIKDEWISKIELKQPIDSTKYFLKARIPKLIKQPVLLNEIEQAINDFPVNFQASEESIGGNTIFKVFHLSDVIFYGKLVYDETIEREFSRLGFLVFTESELDSMELVESKLFIPSFELLISLNEDCKKIINQIKRFGLNYSVLLDDEIADEFALSDNDSKKSLVMSVKKIVKEFPDSKNFIIDVNTELYNSKIFPLVVLEFQKRNIQLKMKHNFHNFLDKPFNDQNSLLKYYCESFKSREVQKIIISFNDLLHLKENILKLRLKGHQFVNPSAE